MKRLLIVGIVICMLMLSGCSAVAATQAAPDYYYEESPAMDAAPSVSKSAEGYSAGVALTGNTTTSTAVDRMVIRNAYLTVVVVDPAKSMEDISALAKEMGGFVVSTNLYKTTTSSGAEIPEASVSIRVLADNLDASLSAIKAMTEKPDEDVLSESISGQDVTSEYTDLTSRLKNLEAAEVQLQKIMEEAVRTEDVLSVYNQLISIREQIEVIKGQMKYYEESSSLSMINVTLKAQESVQPLKVGGWQPVGVARDALQALINTLKALGNILIWLIILILPVGAVLYGFVRLVIWIIRKIFPPRKKIAQVQPLPIIFPDVEGKMTYDVILKDLGPKKSDVISAVRDLTGGTLTSAQALCTKLPAVILKDVSKETAKKAAEKLQLMGGVVEIA